MQNWVGARELETLFRRLGKRREELASAGKSAGWKLALAAALKAQTTVTNRSLGATLHMGYRHEVSRRVATWARQADWTLAKRLKLTSNPKADPFVCPGVTNDCQRSRLVLVWHEDMKKSARTRLLRLISAQRDMSYALDAFERFKAATNDRERYHFALSMVVAIGICAIMRAYGESKDRVFVCSE